LNDPISWRKKALLGEPLGMIHYCFGGLIIAGGLWGTLGKEHRHSKEK
jgi:hypothetical protein